MKTKCQSVFSELYFSQYEMSVDEKNIKYVDGKKGPITKVNSIFLFLNCIIFLSRKHP